MRSARFLLLSAAATLLLIDTRAEAAGTVQLELFGDGSLGSNMLYQQWGRVLSQAGIRNVRIRTRRTTDKLEVSVRGTDANPIYLVTGLIRSENELVLPSGRYRRTDMGKLKRWLDDLAKLGPTDRREPKAAFGLTASQFEELLNNASRPVGFSTRGMSRSAAVDRLGGQLKSPLQFDPGTRQALGNDKIAEDLGTLSSGTALAYILRPMGLCMVPRRLGARPSYRVMKAKKDLEIWPVGWEPDKPARDVLPALYGFHNINIQNIPASRAIEAFGKLLKVPVLLDHNAMARHGIDPAKTMVNHPGSRTTYSLGLKKVLFQAGLKFEVREDEAGQAFLWITTVKPV